MAAAVHPHLCTVDLHEKPTDQILINSYRKQGNDFAIERFRVPAHDLKDQPAANAPAVDSQSSTDQPAGQVPPNGYNNLGGNSTRNVFGVDACSTLASDPNRHPAEDVTSIPSQFSRDESAVDASVASVHETNYHAAEEGNLIHYQIPECKFAENISVNPDHGSEDKPAESTSDHDQEHHKVGDAFPIPHHHQPDQTSDSRPVAPPHEASDKPADKGFDGSHSDQEHQPSAQTFVSPIREPESTSAGKVPQTWDRVLGTQPNDDFQLVPNPGSGSESPGQTLVTPDFDSKINLVEEVPEALISSPKDNSHLADYCDSGHSLKHDALLAAIHDNSNKSGENASVPSHHIFENKLPEETFVADDAKDKPIKHAVVISNHLSSSNGKNEIVLDTPKDSGNDLQNDTTVFSSASKEYEVSEASLTLNRDSGKKRADDAVLSLSRDPGDQTAQDPLERASHDSRDQAADEALLISSQVSNGQTAEATLSVLCQESNYQPTDDELVVSPYTLPSHLLRLHTVSKPNQLLAKALTHMRAIREDYATAAYIESFNWSAIVDALYKLSKEEAYRWQPEIFYIVVFRSRVRQVTNRVDLGLMDAKAHEEAMQSGGLLKYWFGVPDANCRNLATCEFPRKGFLPACVKLIILGIWRNQEDAKRGGRGEGHQRAMRAIAGLYTEWKLERLKFVIERGEHDELVWDICEW